MTGQLNAFAEHQAYRFTASPGDVVLAAVAGNAAGGAIAELYDPSGALLKASAVNGTTGSVALQTTGTYTILVRSNSPLQTQNYGLSLQFTKGECGSSIACGQSMTGQLNTFAAYQPYRFTANSGDVVLVAAAGNAAGGAIAELYDPSGALLKASGVNGTTGSVALQTTGTYTILVRSNSPLQTQNYGLSLQFTKGECGMGIACGQSLAGTLDSFAAYQPYRFMASSGGVVVVSVAGNAAGGAVAELYDPSGTLLKASAVNGTTGSVALQATGTYTILVRSNSPLQTQNYGLTLSCLSAP